MCAELKYKRYTFQKNFYRVALIVKYLKNERITLAWWIFSFFTDLKKRLQKKLEDFEQNYNGFGGDESDFLLESQWNTNLDRPLLLTFDWNIPISKACHLLCVRKSLTFFWRRIFWIGKNIMTVKRVWFVHFWGILRSEQLCKKFFEKLYLTEYSSAHIYEFPERTSGCCPCHASTMSCYKFTKFYRAQNY